MFLEAFKLTLPVLFGYLPLGMAFGLLFQNLDVPWWLASLTSLFVYAGAAQFLAIGLLAAQATPIELFVATFLINLRHIFFGFSFLKRYTFSWLPKGYLIFGLTDETYSVLTAHHPKQPEKDKYLCLWVTALNHSYWVLGSTLGALLGSTFALNTQGFEFTLVALFAVLTLEQAYALKEPFPFWVALGCGCIALLVAPQHMLLIALTLALGIFILTARYHKETSS